MKRSIFVKFFLLVLTVSLIIGGIVLVVSLKSVVAAKYRVILNGFIFFLAACVLIIILSGYLSKSTIDSLNKLRIGLERIRKGDLDYQIEVATGDEIEQLADEFNKMTKGLKNLYFELNKEKIKISSVISSLVDGLLMLDNAGRVSIINPKMLSILKIEEKDAMGKNMIEFIESGKSRNLSKIYEIIRGGLKKRDLSDFEVGLGNAFYKIDIVPVFLDGYRAFGQIIVLHDITREKNIEKLKTEFVSLAAHQLRTPISPIKWILNMFLNGELGSITEHQAQFISKAYQSSERVLALIDDLLDVTKIEEGRFLGLFTEQSVENIIEKVINSYVEVNEEIKKKRINFTFKKPKTALPLIKFDVEKMGLVLRNLIDNAARYNVEGGEVTVSTEYDKINGAIVIAIKDTGIGIPAGQRERIFDKFFRASNAVKTDTTGTGLGLFICKNIVEAHGGKIEIESEEGKGTTVKVVLPIKNLAERTIN